MLGKGCAALPYPARCHVNPNVAAHIKNKCEAKRLHKEEEGDPLDKGAPRPNPIRRPLGASGMAN
jgi:hypothetical protein